MIGASCTNTDAGCGSPPPGCTCKYAGCSDFGDPTGYTNRGVSGECEVATTGGCPAANNKWKSVDCKTDAQIKAESAPCTDTGAGCPPPGCRCKSASGCSNFNDPTSYASRGVSGECEAATTDGCPAADTALKIDCKSDAPFKMENLLKGFSAFPNGSPTTFKLPCVYPSTTFGDTPSADVSPCIYPGH